MADEKQDIQQVPVEVEEEAVEIEVEDTPEEPAEETAAEEAEEKPAEEEEKSEAKPEEEKMVPLKALEAERKKWQARLQDPELQKAKAIAERLKATTGKDYDAIQRELDELQIKRYTDEGIDPALAQSIVYQQRKLAEMEQAIRKQRRDIEVAELKQNPIFKNIELYRDEVEAHADAKNMSLKVAFLDLYGDALYADLERQIEQRILANLQKKQALKVDTSQTGVAKVQPKVSLTADEEAIAKLAGMSPAEYAALKKIQSPDEYKKLKSKK